MSLHWIGTWLLLLPLTAAAEQTNKYPRADLLIEAADLAKPEIAKQYRILDARGKNSYREGHIPNAVWVDVTTWTRAAKDLQDRNTWEELIRSLAIGDNTRVVVYGDKLPDTARVWWILHYWGIREVRLLNGGWKAWQQAGGPVSKDVPTVPKIAVKLIPHPERLTLKDQLLRSLKDHSLQIIDTRSTPEYCGQAKTAERNGAIPGAIHREWSDLVNPQTGRFKSPAELARLLRESGIDAKRPTVTYCQSGGRAAVMAFALELMGLKDVRNYYRSWSEWGNAPDTPIVKPEKPARSPKLTDRAAAEQPLNPAEKHLQLCEKKLKGLNSFVATVRRISTDRTFGDSTVYAGTMRYLKPDMSLLEMRRKGKPHIFEKYVRTGSLVYDYLPEDKRIRVFKVSTLRDFPWIGNLLFRLFEVGTPPFSLLLKTGETQRLFHCKIAKEDQQYIYIELTPRAPEAKTSWQKARVVLTKRTYLPREFWFQQANGNEVKWDIPKIEVNVPVQREEFTNPPIPPGWELVRVPSDPDKPSKKRIVDPEAPSKP